LHPSCDDAAETVRTACHGLSEDKSKRIKIFWLYKKVGIGVKTVVHFFHLIQKLLFEDYSNLYLLHEHLLNA